MPRDQVHCVFVGIDEYRDPNIGDLRCAVRDAEAMGDLFDTIGASVTLLLKSDATLMAIRRAIWRLSRTVEPNDTAVVSFSGHGARLLLPSRTGDSKMLPSILPYDAHHDDLIATSMAMEELGRCFDSIPCKRVLFLLDSCYSGSIAAARAFSPPGEKGLVDAEPILPAISGDGLMILAASQEFEPSFEDTETGHGLFTEFLLDALSGKAQEPGASEISLDSVHKYLQDKVPKKAQRLFKHKQTPIQHGTFTERFVFPVMRRPDRKTLTGFPFHFSPLTVVVGDRREPTPKNAGDLFALSASAAELRWLLSLRLPAETEIVSDKVFVQASESFLRKQFGSTNLLVVGSPAANLLARSINDTALFPFSVPREARDHYRKVRDEVSGFEDNRPALMNYFMDPTNRSSQSFYMNLFQKGGFIDPTYSHRRRGDRIPHDKDYGTVSLACNPYSESGLANYVSILAAGVSLPGTMHSLLMLKDARSTFVERPFGGIFSVELTHRDWVRRVTDAVPEWSTEPYDAERMRSGLQSLMPKAGEGVHFAEGELEVRLRFLDQLLAARVQP